MAALQGQAVNSILNGILICPNNTGLTGTIQYITDGAAVASVLGLSTSGVTVNGIFKIGTSTLTLPNNFTISGNYATTLTVTNTTNVTLPTTGTLITASSTDNLTNKTIVAPVLSGSVTGTYTLAGTPTLTSPTINTPTITSPTLTTPILGTVVSGNIAACTAYPLASLTGAATGVLTFLATPSSANLLAALTTKTGTGSAVFATSPTIATATLTSATLTSPTMTAPVLGVATGTSFNTITGVASASDQVTGTSAVVTVTPSVQQNHYSAAKFWVSFTVTSTVVAIVASYNVASVVRNSAGNYTINYTTSFANTNYMVTGNASQGLFLSGSRSTSSCSVNTTNSFGLTGVDMTAVNVVGYGLQ